VSVEYKPMCRLSGLFFLDIACVKIFLGDDGGLKWPAAW
jgi:hypothetical protein